MAITTVLTIEPEDEFEDVCEELLYLIGFRMPDYVESRSMLYLLMMHSELWNIDANDKDDIGNNIESTHLNEHWPTVGKLIHKHLYNLGVDVQKLSLELKAKNNEQAPSGGRKINHDHVDGCDSV